MISKTRLVLLCGSIYQHFNSFSYGYLFNLYFAVKNNGVQYRLNAKWCHLMWATLFIQKRFWIFCGSRIVCVLGLIS